MKMSSSSESVSVGVGFDTARFGHHVTFLDQNLQFAIKPFGFGESREGYDKLEEAFRNVVRKHGDVHFCIRIDAAGQYSDNLQMFLRNLKFSKTISLGEPKRNKDYRSVHFPKRKSDSVESQACARFAIVERPKESLETPAEIRQLREVLSALQSQTKRSTRLSNQLHNRLSRAFPELTLLTQIVCPSVLKLLKKYPTAKRVSAARLASIKAIPYLRDKKAQQIHQAAKQSTASQSGEIIEQIIRELVSELENSLNAEKRLEELLKKAFAALPPGNHIHLDSIDGVGKLTAAALVASAVSIDRFETADALVNFFGVFPQENTSGFDKRGKPVPPDTMHMCQKGNDLVRKQLYMAALSGIQRNPIIAELYHRKLAKGKRGDVAVGHCMTKLLHLMFAIWKSGKPFDPNYRWQQKTQKTQKAQHSQAEQKAETSAEKVAGSVTATAINASNPAANKSPSGLIDFADLRRQISMEQLLSHIGYLKYFRGSTQRRGPCPIHVSRSTTSTSFSVNLEENVFQCFSKNCGAKGNVLDLWAQLYNLPLPKAATQMSEIFGVPLRYLPGTEKRNP